MHKTHLTIFISAFILFSINCKKNIGESQAEQVVSQDTIVKATKRPPDGLDPKYSTQHVFDSLLNLSYKGGELPHDYYLDYEDLSDSTYLIKWGKKGGKSHVSKKVFPVLGSGKAGYSISNENAIFLRQSCGTSCAYILVLPMNGDTISKYYHPQAISNELDLIVFASLTSHDEPLILNIVNYLNNKKQVVLIDNICKSGTKHDCIQACYFEGDELVLIWEGRNWASYENRDLRIKRIPVKLE